MQIQKAMEKLLIILLLLPATEVCAQRALTYTQYVENPGAIGSPIRAKYTILGIVEVASGCYFYIVLIINYL